MRKFIRVVLSLLLTFSCYFTTPTFELHAQNFRIRVVATCGTLTLNSSSSTDLYVDTTGKLCSSMSNTTSTPLTVQGFAMTSYQCTSIGTAGCIISQAATTLGSIICTNTDAATDYWIQLLNTNSPSLGTTVPKNAFMIPHGGYGGAVDLNLSYDTAVRIFGTTTRNGSAAAGSGVLDCNGGFRLGN